MADKIAPIRLGSRVCFADRWQGRVSSLEVDESWEVLNIGISSGFLFASSSIRLPFTSVTPWSDDSVKVGATSVSAFAREIPPVAAPARPLDAGTPISNPSTRFAGLLVRESTRRVEQIIVSHGVQGLFRVPLSEVSFSGKTLAIAVGSQQLVRYYPDAEIHEHVHRMLADDTTITLDEKSSIHIDVENGAVILRGNVRVRPIREHLHALAAKAPGAVQVRDETKDDFEIEASIGQALDAAGLQRDAKVYVRSNLGYVVLLGFAPSQRALDDITRTVVRVPGVRNVANRMKVAPAAAAAR